MLYSYFQRKINRSKIKTEKRKMKTQNRDRNKAIILYYLSGKSLSETGMMFDISPQRVHQILVYNRIPRHKYGIILSSSSQISQISKDQNYG